jgi:hypothetical protein
MRGSYERGRSYRPGSDSGTSPGYGRSRAVKEPCYIDLEEARRVLAEMGVALSPRQMRRAADMDARGRRKLPFFLGPTYNDATVRAVGLPMDCEHWAGPELLWDALIAPNQGDTHLPPHWEPAGSTASIGGTRRLRARCATSAPRFNRDDCCAPCYLQRQALNHRATVEHAGHTRATGAPKLSYRQTSPQLATGNAAGRGKSRAIVQPGAPRGSSFQARLVGRLYRQPT